MLPCDSTEVKRHTESSDREKRQRRGREHHGREKLLVWLGEGRNSPKKL